MTYPESTPLGGPTAAASRVPPDFVGRGLLSSPPGLPPPEPDPGSLPHLWSSLGTTTPFAPPDTPAFDLGASSQPSGPAPARKDVSSVCDASGDVFPLRGSALREEGEFSFESWIAALPRLLRRGRTQLSRFLLSTLNLPRGFSSPTAALFPLPLSREGIFLQRACRDAASRRRLAVQRCTHLVAMCLNFMHAGCKPVPLRSLQRPLSSLQAQVYERIAVLVRACARRAGPVPVCAGRRSLHLAARLSEVLCFVERSGLTPGAYPGDADLSEGSAFLPHEDHGLEALQPYRDIRADQVALFGRGAWDLSVHLDPDLYMPFVEPEVLMFSGSGAPCASFAKEDRKQILGMCKLWDASNLLGFVPGPLPDRMLTRLFGAFKSPGKLRQIGDRRGRNSYECHLGGPSRYLPAGQLLCRIHVPLGSCLAGSLTDRKDFYSQAKISEQRSWTNAIGPSFKLREFLDTSAAQSLLSRGRFSEQCGRSLGTLESSRPPALLVSPDAIVHPTFWALLQGDAGGVEYATGGHQGLLREWGCLHPSRRLLGKHPVPLHGPWEGLIIDDFFALGVESKSFVAGADSASSRILSRAKQAYASEAVAGSDDKDVWSQRVLKVAGAEIDSSEATVGDGATFISYPATKRLALAAASIRAAECPVVSEELVSSLTGSWVSCLLFRRCRMSALDGLFQLGRTSSSGEPGSPLRPLSRKVAGELQLLSVLAPVIATNAAAKPSPRVYASDASMSRGAFCTAPIAERFLLELWLAADFKGHPVRLQPASPAETAEGQETLESSSIRKPPACHFDILEVSSKAGHIAGRLAALGFVVGPVIDPRRSPHYNLGSWRLKEWIFYLLAEGRVKALVLGPAAASFSPAIKPPIRTIRQPSGINRKELRTLAGNTEVFACCALFLAALRHNVPVLMWHPAGSYARSLACWSSLISRGFADESVMVASPAASSQRSAVAVVSRGLGPFVTSGDSSPFKEELEIFHRLADSVADALRSSSGEPSALKSGVENVAVNDLLLTGAWRVGGSWTWKRRQHINVLESCSAYRVALHAAKSGGDSKEVLLLDSAVARGAISKGRTSSRMLRPVLLRSAAVTVAGGIHLGMHHAPTKLNVSDDPTRSVDLREPVGASVVAEARPECLNSLCGLGGLSAARASWLRLACLLTLRVASFGLDPFLKSLSSPLRASLPPPLTETLSEKGRPRARLFDATLGYPGEGPVLPRNLQDRKRKDARSAVTLPEGRPVLPRTQQNRTMLLTLFSAWLLENGFDEDSYTRWAAEEVAKVLERYGRELFEAGRPYWHLSETINAVAAKRPAIRRQLQGCWDLAFTWMQLEPSTHHVAMPAIILLALLSVCLTWGWRTEAGIFALAWGALLRIGEATGSIRASLVLPRDVLWSQHFVLLKIGEPKTRLRAARHQAAKVEAKDLVDLVDIAFAHLPANSKLWPFTAQTLRKRLDTALEALSIPTARSSSRPLDLGSFRPGGATYLLQASEDAELVRRRGRWVSGKVMEIYLQEVAASVFFPSLPLGTRRKVMQASACFPDLLRRATMWTRNKIPTGLWYNLCSSGSVATGDGDKGS